jgi:hypothetical protein
MTRKQKALKIAEMWDDIATSETPLGFWYQNLYIGWTHVTAAPQLESDMMNWKVAKSNSQISRGVAKYFANLWREVAEDREMQYWSSCFQEWLDTGDYGPNTTDQPSSWRIKQQKVTPKAAPEVVAWKRTDTGEFTDDLNEAAYWEKRNYPLQKLAVVEEA